LKTVIHVFIGIATIIASNGQTFSGFGARETGLAETAVNLKGAASAGNNPAGMSFAQHLSTMMFFRSRMIQEGLLDVGIMAVLPRKSMAYGLAMAYLGDELLSHSQVGLALSHSMGKASVGLRLNYDQIHLQGYGYSRALSLDMGVMYHLTNQLQLSMTIENSTRSKYTRLSESRLPLTTSAGFAYKPIEEVLLSVEFDFEEGDLQDLKVGLEYAISQVVALRTGFAGTSNRAFAGFGFKLSPFNFDLAGSYHQFLGYSSVVSIQYQFKK